MRTTKQHEGFTLVELLVVIVIIGILAALVLPAIAEAMYEARVTACASNLNQLWKMQHIYMSRYGTSMKIMPPYTGGQFWRALEETPTPLLDDPTLLICPVRGDGQVGDLDYLGPATPVGRLRPREPVGGDFMDGPVNHNRDEKGNFLFKNGSVLTVGQEEWESWTEARPIP